METAEAWKSIFENWPEAVPREGLVVTSLNETIPFVNFLISGSILLIERDTPDTFGARKVMVGYDAINAVKITSAMELGRFQVMGFQAPF
ncbi:MAG: hypothetical protein ACE5KM_20910 [Planctomycetaceae bacterium]